MKEQLKVIIGFNEEDASYVRENLVKYNKKQVKYRKLS